MEVLNTGLTSGLTSGTRSESLSASAPDRLAKFRELVKTEATTNKMSASLIERLRDSKAQHPESAAAAERFKNALTSVVVTKENLTKLMKRVHDATFSKYPPGEEWKRLDRRVRKLHWFTKAGFLLGSDIDSRELLLFFSELTTPEFELSDPKFDETWDDASAQKLLRYRIEHGLTPNPKPVRKKRAPNKSYRERLSRSSILVSVLPSEIGVRSRKVASAVA